jgi:hypothetical protein
MRCADGPRAEASKSACSTGRRFTMSGNTVAELSGTGSNALSSNDM